MHSKGHRANLLDPDYREVGIGVATGNPSARDGRGATYATEFGTVDGVSRPARQLERRVARTGWLHRRPEWLLGEAVAWGRGRFAAPSAIVAAWIRSPQHRRVALRSGFRRVGIAIAAGTPFGAGDGATFVADFGGAARRSSGEASRHRDVAVVDGLREPQVRAPLLRRVLR